jgi:hypothetical protein
MKDFLDADDNAEPSYFHPVMVLLTFLVGVNELLLSWKYSWDRIAFIPTDRVTKFLILAVRDSVTLYRPEAWWEAHYSSN